VPSLILVVDEDPQIHQVVGRWLADAGYECMNALTHGTRGTYSAPAAPTAVILAEV
jgi:DNA-binding response OmpR family regulator